jgi:hypothetical protein
MVKHALQTVEVNGVRCTADSSAAGIRNFPRECVLRIAERLDAHPTRLVAIVHPMGLPHAQVG